MLGLTILSLIIWISLVGFRDRFWRTDQQLPELNHASPSAIQTASAIALPRIAIVIPARNEADLLPQTLPALFNQSYTGPIQIILVDDNSSDDTAAIAEQIRSEQTQQFSATSQANPNPTQLQVISGQPLPNGWTGKLWALHQGIEIAQAFQPDYILLTDADILHPPDSLEKLIHQAIAQDCDLVSLMVKLRAESIWERWLVPAFVFFFAKLYPFRTVNNPQRSLGAAAGGCSLVRRTALEKMGGISTIRNALIDDCTLGQTLKRSGNGRIWLGLTQSTLSLRPYDSLASLWAMISRSAYAQLNHSPFLLVGTLFGMAIVYLVPPVALSYSILSHNLLLAVLAGTTYSLMTIAFFPMVNFYRQPWLLSLTLPAIASLYLMMTIDSARQYYQGNGGRWKGRTYGQKT